MCGDKAVPCITPCYTNSVALVEVVRAKLCQKNNPLGSSPTYCQEEQYTEVKQHLTRDQLSIEKCIPLLQSRP